MLFQTELTSRIRLVIQKSRTATVAVIVAAILFSTVALLIFNAIVQTVNAQTDALRDQAALLEQENAKLETSIDQLGSVDSVEDIAKEELGLINPDSVIIEPEN